GLLIGCIIGILITGTFAWASTFPGALNSFSTGDIIEAVDWNAIEATIGITSSASTTSLTYKINNRPTYAYASSTYFQLSGGIVTASSTFLGVLTVNGLYQGNIASTTFGFGTETINQIVEDTLNKGILDTITVTDEGGINISWTAGEIYDQANKTIVDTNSSGSTGLTDDNVNYLKWVSGSSLTLNTTAPSGDEISVAVINAQDGDIYEGVHQDSLINVRESNLQIGLADTFPVEVTEGLIVSEDTDATRAFDVELTSGIYYHDLHEKHTVSATTTQTSIITIWCGGNVYQKRPDIIVNSWCDSSSMASTSANKYYAWLFFQVESRVHSVAPETEYANLNAAITGGATQSLPTGLVNEPKTMSVILKGNDVAFPTAEGERWVDERPIIGSSIRSSTSDHGNLSGL
ncbi:hypothetical protein LCGC14_2817170, partial [marine sediment metagenome]